MYVFQKLRGKRVILKIWTARPEETEWVALLVLCSRINVNFDTESFSVSERLTLFEKHVSLMWTLHLSFTDKVSSGVSPKNLLLCNMTF